MILKLTFDIEIVFDIDISIFAKNKSNMKKIILLAIIACSSFANAQAFKGKGDVKGQVGAFFQKGGSGIHISSVWDRRGSLGRYS